MSLEPGGMNATSSVSWNYSDPNKEGYCESFTGTVLTIQEVQARQYSPNGVGAPKFWQDGNPVMNMRILFALPDGSFRSWTFGKASKKQVAAYNAGLKPCTHMQLFDLTGRTRMGDLVGKTLMVSTQPGNYGSGNPRPFMVQLAQDGPYQAAQEIPEEFKVSPLLCNDGASGGQYNNQQQPPMAGQFYSAPRPQQQPMQQPMQPMQQGYPQQPYGYQQQQPMQQQYPQQYQVQPMQQGYQQQPMQQQIPQPVMSAPIPQGMDPAVAAAMQQLGATNIQPIDPMYNDLPF